jgi:hypothetical protein
MYVKTCAGGYPNPIFAGRNEILGFRATVNTLANNSRVSLWDDAGISETDKTGYVRGTDYAGKTKLADVKGDADVDGNLEVIFPESIKTRRGISAAFENIVAGTFILYVR